jgi:hypothetical protein
MLRTICTFFQKKKEVQNSEAGSEMMSVSGSSRQCQAVTGNATAK